VWPYVLPENVKKLTKLLLPSAAASLLKKKAVQKHGKATTLSG
jgi:hypothetical protein